MVDKNMDFTHLSDYEKTNGIKITNVPQYLREKAYLTDFSETLAQLAEMIIQLGVNLSLDPDEALDWAMQLNRKITNGQVTMGDLTQEVKEAMTGGGGGGGTGGNYAVHLHYEISPNGSFHSGGNTINPQAYLGITGDNTTTLPRPV